MSESNGPGPDDREGRSDDPSATADTDADGGSAAPSPGSDVGTDLPDVPVWDDEYVDRVSDRLMASYDLEKDYRVRGERFTLYGNMRVVNEKHFLHPALSYGRHHAAEHLFVAREDAVSVDTLDRLVDLGHDLADDWIEPDERHYSTDFTFVVVTDDVSGAVRDRVTGFSDRTLLKYGYNGHYEINLVVVAPAAETCVASEGADVAAAFRLWESVESREGESRGLFERFLG